MSGDTSPLPNTSSWCGAQLKEKEKQLYSRKIWLPIEVGTAEFPFL
jgi:hypothetical protein